AGCAFVLGSQAPLEDCYAPDLVPDDGTLAREHAAMAANLAAAGVDGVLVETHNTIREAVAAVRAAAGAGLLTLVSFVCGRDGRLLSGETITHAAQAVFPFRPAAVLINCTPAPSTVAPLRELHRAVGDLPVGAYANVGEHDPERGWIPTDAVFPERYAEYAAQWRQAGATLIGGCCGTTPEHIRCLRELLGQP
ncbi:MAG TPA: homocysteine S-methyltransferase family protein, partial [Planctomycetaceae bacterium]|nr:homocysteine S-methyltransferase family protein [Planctomycetaceae bacterium]